MRKRSLCIFLVFIMVLTLFNVISIQTEAASEKTKIYKAAKKEKELFKKEAEYYGYTITEDKMVSRTKKKVKWHMYVRNYDPKLNDDGIECAYYRLILVTRKTTYWKNGSIPVKVYETEYYGGKLDNPIGDRRCTIDYYLKEDSLPISVHWMLEKKSKSAAKSLKKSIEAKKGKSSEITSKYVKSDKTGRSDFTATNAKGEEYKISVRYHRGKKPSDKSSGQIIAKYYLNGKASTKKKILKKF